MGAKKYFKNELQWSNFNLEHDVAPDFYLGCWQNNRSCVPLLCLRAILCAGNIAIVIASMVLLQLGRHGYWWIYLTQWGIFANALTTLFALGLSFGVYFNGPIDSSFGLPWYIKVYWILYNATVPVAFLITIFYWTMINSLDIMELLELNPVLDIFIHGMNSVMMLVLVLTARHPSRVLHFYHSVAFMIVYLIFNVIYYAAGGTDPNGNVWVYPMLDWTNPGPAIVVVVAVAIGIIILHFLVVLIALCRNYFSRRYRKQDRSFSISE